MAAFKPKLLAPVLAFVGLIASLTHTLVLPVIPALPELLGASAATVSWLVTSTVVVTAVANPILGRLGDQFGLRRMLLVALSALLIGSIVCALTSDVAVLITGRAIQGVSVAAIPLGISLIAREAEPGRRAYGIALVSAMLGVGGAVGLPFAGVIVQTWNFHGLFWVTAAGGVVAIVALLWIVPPTALVAEPARVDVAGAVLLALALAGSLVVLSKGNAWGWGSAPVLVLVATAVIALGGFLPLQLRRRHPLLQIRLALQRPVLLTNMASTLSGFAMFANFLSVTSVLQASRAAGGFGLSVLETGLALLPNGLLMALFSPVAGRLIEHRGARMSLLAGFILTVAGFVLRLTLDDAVWQVIAAASVISIGTGLAYSALPALILDATPPGHAAAASGLNALARGFGSAIASATFGALAAGGAAAVAGAGTARLLWLGAAAAVGALAAVVLLPRRAAEMSGVSAVATVQAPR